MSVTEYRDAYGIPRGQPLTCADTRVTMQAGIRSTIDAGALANHYATNADRAPEAAKLGSAVKRELAEAGRHFGRELTPRCVIEAIVREIEGGMKVATAVKRSPISYTTFHEGLERHPDLKARMSSPSPPAAPD